MRSAGLVLVGALWGVVPARPAQAAPPPAVTPPSGVSVSARASSSQAKVLSRAFAAVAGALSPSVVRIDVVDTGRAAAGIVIDTDGHIVTSSHALGDGAAVAVTFTGERRLEARVVGRDPQTDVALLRLSSAPRDLTAARFGDSDLIEVGAWTLAVGVSRGADQPTVAGIVSGRIALPATAGPGTPALIQTDADASLGSRSAGGALANLDGEVIGLLVAAGFAVPINDVRRVAQMLIKEGRALHPYIGVALLDVADLDADERQLLGGRVPHRGAVISRVTGGASASRAGLLPGDVITSINNQDVETPSTVAAFVSAHDVGGKLMVSFVRDGRERTVAVVVDPFVTPPASAPPFAVGNPRSVTGTLASFRE